MFFFFFLISENYLLLSCSKYWYFENSIDDFFWIIGYEDIYSALCQFCFWKFVIDRAVMYLWASSSVLNLCVIFFCLNCVIFFIEIADDDLIQLYEVLWSQDPVYRENLLGEASFIWYHRILLRHWEYFLYFWKNLIVFIVYLIVKFDYDNQWFSNPTC